MKKLFFVVGIFSLICFSSKATVIKIETGTMTSEINEKIKLLLPGDTLLFESGVFFGAFEWKDIHGKPNCPIVIKGAGPDKTTIDGGAPEPDSDLDNYAVLIRNSSWLQFEDFAIRNAWVDVFKVNESAYISVRNCDIVGGKRVIFANGRKSHHFLVEKCRWEQDERVWTHAEDFTWTEIHHGIHRHYNGSIFQGKLIGGSFVIRDNQVKNVFNAFRLSMMGDTAGDTIACTNGEIYRNTVINSSDNAFEPEVYSKNLHYYHNVMINGHAFLSITEVGGGPIYIYGNTALSLPDCEDGWCIYKFSNATIPLTKPLYVFNNSWQVDYNLLGRDEPHRKNDYIKHFNNACFFEKMDSVGIFNLGKLNEFDYDCSNIPFPYLLTGAGHEKNAIIADPQFVNGTYGDFRLKDTSPCRDSGKPLDFITLGLKRETIDRGAYDHGELVEGPIFQYADPGTEVSHKDLPQITRYKVIGNQLRLAFSSPIDPESILASDLSLKVGEDIYSFQSIQFAENNYILILNAKDDLPMKDICLIVKKWPIGMNGETATSWASDILVIDQSRKK